MNSLINNTLKTIIIMLLMTSMTQVWASSNSKIGKDENHYIVLIRDTSNVKQKHHNAIKNILPSLLYDDDLTVDGKVKSRREAMGSGVIPKFDASKDTLSLAFFGLHERKTSCKLNSGKVAEDEYFFEWKKDVNQKSKQGFRSALERFLDDSDCRAQATLSHSVLAKALLLDSSFLRKRIEGKSFKHTYILSIDSNYDYSSGDTAKDDLDKFFTLEIQEGIEKSERLNQIKELLKHFKFESNEDLVWSATNNDELSKKNTKTKHGYRLRYKFSELLPRSESLEEKSLALLVNVPSKIQLDRVVKKIDGKAEIIFNPESFNKIFLSNNVLEDEGRSTAKITEHISDKRIKALFEPLSIDYNIDSANIGIWKSNNVNTTGRLELSNCDAPICEKTADGWIIDLFGFIYKEYGSPILTESEIPYQPTKVKIKVNYAYQVEGYYSLPNITINKKIDITYAPPVIIKGKQLPNIKSNSSWVPFLVPVLEFFNWIKKSEILADTDKYFFDKEKRLDNAALLDFLPSQLDSQITQAEISTYITEKRNEIITDINVYNETLSSKIKTAEIITLIIFFVLLMILATIGHFYFRYRHFKPKIEFIANKGSAIKRLGEPENSLPLKLGSIKITDVGELSGWAKWANLSPDYPTIVVDSEIELLANESVELINRDQLVTLDDANKEKEMTASIDYSLNIQPDTIKDLINIVSATKNEEKELTFSLKFILNWKCKKRCRAIKAFKKAGKLEYTFDFPVKLIPEKTKVPNVTFEPKADIHYSLSHNSIRIGYLNFTSNIKANFSEPVRETFKLFIQNKYTGNKIGLDAGGVVNKDSYRESLQLITKAYHKGTLDYEMFDKEFILSLEKFLSQVDINIKDMGTKGLSDKVLADIKLINDTSIDRLLGDDNFSTKVLDYTIKQKFEKNIFSMSSLVGMTNPKEELSETLWLSLDNKELAKCENVTQDYKLLVEHNNKRYSDEFSIKPDPNDLKLFVDLALNTHSSYKYHLHWNAKGALHQLKKENNHELEPVTGNVINAEQGYLIEVSSDYSNLSSPVIQLNFSCEHKKGDGEIEVELAYAVESQMIMVENEINIRDESPDLLLKEEKCLENLFALSYDNDERVQDNESASQLIFSIQPSESKEVRTFQLTLDKVDKLSDIISNIGGDDATINLECPTDSMASEKSKSIRLGDDSYLTLVLEVKAKIKQQQSSQELERTATIRLPLALSLEPSDANRICLDYGTSAVVVANGDGGGHADLIPLQGWRGADMMNLDEEALNHCDYSEMSGVYNPEEGTPFLPSIMSYGDYEIKLEHKEIIKKYVDKDVQDLYLSSYMKCKRIGGPNYLGERIKKGEANFVSFPAMQLLYPEDEASERGKQEVELIKKLESRTLYALKSWLALGIDSIADSMINMSYDQIILDKEKNTLATKNVKVADLVQSSLAALVQSYLSQSMDLEMEQGSSIILTYPNSYTPYQQQDFLDLALEAFKQPLGIRAKRYISLVSESDAAGAAVIFNSDSKFAEDALKQYNASHHNRAGNAQKKTNKRFDQVVLIYDLGAGTLDASLIKLTWSADKKVNMLEKWETLARLGLPLAGNHIDKLLALKIHHLLNNAKETISNWSDFFHYQERIVRNSGRTSESDKYRYKSVMKDLIKNIKEAKHNWSTNYFAAIDEGGNHEKANKSCFNIIIYQNLDSDAVSSTVKQVVNYRGDRVKEFNEAVNSLAEKPEDHLINQPSVFKQDGNIILSIPSCMIQEDERIKFFFDFISDSFIQELLSNTDILSKDIDAVIFSGRGMLFPELKERIYNSFRNDTMFVFGRGINDSTSNDMKSLVAEGGLQWHDFSKNKEKCIDKPLEASLWLEYSGHLYKIPKNEPYTNEDELIRVSDISHSAIRIYSSSLRKIERKDLSHPIKKFFCSPIKELSSKELIKTDCEGYYRFYYSVLSNGKIRLTFIGPEGSPSTTQFKPQIITDSHVTAPWPTGEVLLEKNYPLPPK